MKALTLHLYTRGPPGIGQCSHTLPAIKSWREMVLKAHRWVLPSETPIRRVWGAAREPALFLGVTAIGFWNRIV